MAIVFPAPVARHRLQPLRKDEGREVEIGLQAAQGLGFNVSSSIVEQQLARTKTMGAYKASTLLDFEKGQPLELQSLFFEPLRQAKKAGVPMPRLEALCAVLSELSRLRR